MIKDSIIPIGPCTFGLITEVGRSVFKLQICCNLPIQLEGLNFWLYFFNKDVNLNFRSEFYFIFKSRLC